jgi:pyrimidine-specific ribonucleoside hydrolase
MTFLLALLLAAQGSPLIIDTDAGTDDLLAISYLLSRPDVHMEAITVVSGVANVHPGASNILRLLDAAGRNDVRVYEGDTRTPEGGHAFPAEWRKLADDLNGVNLPRTSHKPEPQRAEAFLKTRIERPCEILALGPLTNLAAALGPKNAVSRLVIMGGAVRVAGNVDSQADAEWNIYADPQAAKKIFASGIPITLIPLDATNHVPIGADYLARFEKGKNTPLGKIAGQILASSKLLIDTHIFYAWDPLAAVAFTNPEVVKTVPIALSITDKGRTQELPGKPVNAQVAVDADGTLFQKLFLRAFQKAQ